MVLVILGRVLRQEKEIKGAQIRKEVKLFFIFSHMILHTENPKDSTKTLAELINQFNKATVHKNQQTINSGEGVEKKEPSYIVGGNAN